MAVCLEILDKIPIRNYSYYVLFTRGASRGVRKWSRVFGLAGLGQAPSRRMRRPARRASQARAREVLGHRPTPLRGSATGWLDAVQVKAKKFAGCAGRRSPTACPRKRGPETENRRDGAPDGVAVASRLRRFGDDAADTESQGAPPGAPSPLMVRGGKPQIKTRRFCARERAGVGGIRVTGRHCAGDNEGVALGATSKGSRCRQPRGCDGLFETCIGIWSKVRQRFRRHART